jgi:hypothetical protein
MSPKSAVRRIPYLRNRLAFGIAGMLGAQILLVLVIGFEFDAIAGLQKSVSANVLAGATFVVLSIPLVGYVAWSTRLLKRVRNAAMAGSFLLCPYCIYGMAGVKHAERRLAISTCPECGKTVDVRNVGELWRGLCRKPRAES